MIFSPFKFPYDHYISGEFNGSANNSNTNLTLYDYNFNSFKLSRGQRLLVFAGYIWTNATGNIFVSFDFDGSDDLQAGEIIFGGPADVNAGIVFPAGGQILSPKLVDGDVGNIRISHSASDTTTVCKIHAALIKANTPNV